MDPEDEPEDASEGTEPDEGAEAADGDVPEVEPASLVAGAFSGSLPVPSLVGLFSGCLAWLGSFNLLE